MSIDTNERGDVPEPEEDDEEITMHELHQGTEIDMPDKIKSEDHPTPNHPTGRLEP